MVKTTYPRTVTEKIVEYWALGFSATETQQALEEKQSITVCLNTIYKHRHSLTAQDLIDELIRRQQRAITKADADNPALAMKYRDKLLEKLIPQKIISLAKTESHEQVDINIQLSEYEQALTRAVQHDLRSKAATEQVDSAQANPETS